MKVKLQLLYNMKIIKAENESVDEAADLTSLVV